MSKYLRPFPPAPVGVVREEMGSEDDDDISMAIKLSLAEAAGRSSTGRPIADVFISAADVTTSAGASGSGSSSSSTVAEDEQLAR